MNHPTPEAWMAYLYHEATAETRADSDAHLAVCPQCREQIYAWRGTLGELDRDDLVITRPTCASPQSARPSVRTHSRFQVLAEKTGGAFRETDTRLNALANALPAPEPDVEDTTP